MSLQILLNGHQRDFAEMEDVVHLAELFAVLGLKSDRIAVEHNGAIVARSQWSATQVKSGDKLEVVHFVGGGTGLGSEACTRP